MRSAAGWLAGRVELTRHQARAEIDLATALDGMPLVAAAFREGRLGRQVIARSRQRQMFRPDTQHDGLIGLRR